MTNSRSGFMRKVTISAEMSKFCGWTCGDPKSRVEVTRYICKYIMNEGLNSDNSTFFLDNKLSKLLNIKNDNTLLLSYYLLQKHIAFHFLYEEDYFMREKYIRTILKKYIYDLCNLL